MIRTLRAAIAASAIALACSGASAQSSFPTVGGSYVDGHALMCPNGSTDFQGRPIMIPCGGASTPVNISGSFTANLGGFQPTAQGTPIGATTAGVAGSLPAGTAGVAQDVGGFPAYCQFGGSATGITNGHYLSGAGAQWAYLVPSGATQITCEGVGGTTQINLYGGTGLGVDTGGGGAAGIAAVKPGQVTPLSPSCQLSVSSSAVQTSTCSGGIPSGTTYALICNEGTAARWRDDGTAPTSSIGQVLGTGTATAPVCAGFVTTLSTLQWIAESGSATLDISFYK